MKDQQRCVQAEQVRIIYSQTAMAVVGPPISAAIFAWIFWAVADHSVLLVWYACLTLISIARIPLYAAFLRQKSDEDQIRPWGSIHIGLTFLQGSLWGIAWLIFIPAQDPIYNVIISMWVIGMSAASVSSYSAHMKAMLMFFLPATVPGVVRLLFLGGQLNTALAAALCIYMAVMMRTTLQINRSIVAAIKLNFDLEQEIEERKRVEERLIEISIKDGLTGLFNRRHFDQVLEQEIRRAQRDANPLSLILVDVDYFKAFNDTYGHPQGDVCLQRISRALEEIVGRPGDLVARYGGEELALILPNTNSVNACKLADALRRGTQALDIVHTATTVAGLEVVTVSAGVATINPARSSTPSDLIQLADAALYRAKKDGRNRVVVA